MRNTLPLRRRSAPAGLNALRRSTLALLLGGCGGAQSALDPHGPQAAATLTLFRLFLGTAAVVWVLVVLALAVAIWRRRGAPRPPLTLDRRLETRAERIVTALTVLTAAIITVLTFASYLTGRGLAAAEPEALSIRVTGHQWWWEVTYQDPSPARVLTTANEIHVPVGQPVRIELTSADVIHSLWVPGLFGKRDLITGRTNEIRFRAAAPGEYRGQCAEFCGLQHAHMALLILVEPPEEFEAWRAAQLQPSAPPEDPVRQRGQQVLETGPCVMCHRVRGTLAGGGVAPDLTHLASRRTIAAGTLPLTRGSLAAWITDPQSVKQGANMPQIKLPTDDFQALVAYLAGLR